VHVGRAGRPEEIAQTISFLCSDEASYISGTPLTPDGGLTLTVLTAIPVPLKVEFLVQNFHIV
jgi:NAD(P)-dependent dehydrogenase (short-subunit alcohol dehydrogenase family)